GCVEIRAVLVIDVPECHVLQNQPHVRDLEEYGCYRPTTNGTADRPDEVGGVLNVLERHLAADEIGTAVPVFFRVVILDNGQPRSVPRCAAARLVSGIETDAVAAAELAEQAQKLALPAADLDDCLAAQPIAFDQRARQFPVKRTEDLGVILRRFVAGAVVVEARIESEVRNKAAGAAEAQDDIALRIAESGLAI